MMATSQPLHLTLFFNTPLGEFRFHSLPDDEFSGFARQSDGNKTIFIPSDTFWLRLRLERFLTTIFQMSSSNNPGASRTTLTPSTTNGTQAKSSGALVPTNNVTTKEGVTVRARIDPTLTVDDVVRQLCVNLKVTDPSFHFALRDRDTDELVTNDNLRKKIKNKVHLRSLFSSRSSSFHRSYYPP